MKRLHLLIGGLCPDFGSQSDAVLAGLALPALTTLLGRGRPLPAPVGGIGDRLGQLFGLDPDPDWPFAPLRLEADGRDPGDDQWWCADPVHLQLMLDYLRVGGGSGFSLESEEADALVASLNIHFAGEAEFLATSPLRWYARFARPLQATSTPLDQARGESVRTCLPRGPDAGRLQRLMNEVQMLFHDHAVNQRREARGQEPVNSLWFWGGGRRSRVDPLRARVLADSALALAVARAGTTPAVRLPGHFDAAASGSDDLLVVLDSLLPLSCDGRMEAWQTEIQRLETAWFAPILAALKGGRIAEVHLEALGPQGQARRLRRLDTWKFWQGPGGLCRSLSR